MNKKNDSDQLEKILNKVFNILSKNKNIQILPILDQYNYMLSDCDDETKELYDRLMAFGYLREKNIIEAEKYIDSQTDKNSLDVSYILTTISFQLREFKKAIENGNEYLKQFENENNNQVSYSDESKYNIFNLVGQSMMMLRKFDEADELFKSALEINPENPQTYLNMIRLAEHLKDSEAINEILESALQNCSDSIELKMLAGISIKNHINSYFQI